MVTLLSSQPDSPCSAPSLEAAARRSEADETENTHLEKISTGRELTMAMLYKKAWKLINCIWLCFVHTLNWTLDSSRS